MIDSEEVKLIFSSLYSDKSTRALALLVMATLYAQEITEKSR